MWRASLLGLVAGTIIGCGAAAPSPLAENSAQKRRNLEPRLDASTPLSLERFGKRLKVGDDAAVVADVFPKPPRAFVFNDLPERLGGDFDARGWESREEGFGAILYSGRVAVAMRQFYGIDSPRFDELRQTVASSARRIEAKTIEGENSSFTFWEAEPQILMVLRRGVSKGNYDVTIAIGDKTVMDALDMSPAKAQSIVDRLAKPAGGGTKGEPTAPTPRPAAPSQNAPPADGKGYSAANSAEGKL